MSTEVSQVLDELAPWKRKRFREYDLSWTRAAESLATDKPLIEARPNKIGSKWTIFDKATDKIAIFHHAGVWMWASPPYTGNLVPDGESAPEGVPQGRMFLTVAVLSLRVSVLDRRAETSYCINTQDDPSFYTAARAVEDYVTSLEDFNKHKRARRPWQRGESEFTRRRFILASRLVVRRTPHNTKDGAPYSAPYTLHPWLEDTLKAQTTPTWVPNPEIPSIIDYVDGKLNMLKPTTNRYFEAGDIVWFSFALTFEINANNWMPEYKPLDFVRVGKLSAPSDTRGEDEVGSAYQSLTEGNVTMLDVDTDYSNTADEDESGSGKRPRDSDGDDTMSDGGLSDMSAYSAAQAALERPEKRHNPIPPASTTQKPASKSDDTLKRRTAAKGKGKAS
ncbi:hypothetical protein B0H16DRAFT_1450979 [Mycena metata]|uniref:Uncharacterized protein n=1 Tax=Mycena metata TaxID=1033252 RepID=A0AAD7JWB1_9AGAR|nr:hypothetical protein B0H16DRAFT_1450979 [Mycena metata]